MKITGTEMNTASPKKAADSRKISEEQNFADQLSEKMAAAHSAKPTENLKPLSGPEKISNVPIAFQVEGSQLSSLQKTALNRAQAALDLIQIYQQRLMDPGVSLKALSPTVMALDREAEDLNQLLSEYPHDDTLKTLILNVADLVKTETIRFSRGDYR